MEGNLAILRSQGSPPLRQRTQRPQITGRGLLGKREGKAGPVGACLCEAAHTFPLEVRWAEADRERWHRGACKAESVSAFIKASFLCMWALPSQLLALKARCSFNLQRDAAYPLLLDRVSSPEH